MFPKFFTGIVYFLATFTIFSPAFAEKEGERFENRTVVYLQEEVKESMAPDRVRATLRIQLQDEQVSEVQDRVNKKVAWAVKQVERAKSVKISTGSYHVQKVYNERTRKHDRWQGAQSFSLKGRDVTALLDLVGVLQEEGFMLGGVQHYLSDAQVQGVQDTLVARAIDRLHVRMAVLSDKLGGKKGRIAELRVNGGYHTRPMHHRGMIEMDTSMVRGAAGAPPVSVAEDQKVSLNIQATVYFEE